MEFNNINIPEMEAQHMGSVQWKNENNKED